MKYDPEIENWMKTFYESLSPTEQRRYAAVEALKLDAEEEGVQYIVELLGCDPLQVDRARQEFVDGMIDGPPQIDDDEQSQPEIDLADGLGGVAAGFGAAAEGEPTDSEADPFGVAVSTDADESATDAGDDFFAAAVADDDEAKEAAAAFWREEGDSAEGDAFSMAPADGGDSEFGGEVTYDDGESASAVLEAAGSSTKKRGKKKGPGPITNVLGIVVFGVVGIVAGYAILVFVAPEKAKQLFDWERAYNKGVAYISSEPPATPDDEGKPVEPNKDFEPGGLVDEDEADLEDYQQDKNNRRNGQGSNGQDNGNGGGAPVDDPFAINPPDSGDVTDPELDDPATSDEGEDDPFGIDIPEIGTPELDVPEIDDPLALPESDAKLIQPAADERYTTAEIDAAIDEVVALSDDDEVKFSRVYLKLCVVGERLAKPTPQAELAAEPRIETLETFLQSVARSRDKLVTVGKFSHDWLFSGKRNPADKGVLLAGTITGVESIQGGHKATVLLLDPDKRNMSVTVVSEKVARYAKGDRVIMLGTIIVDPTTELENYDGDESPIVYPAVTAKL